MATQRSQKSGRQGFTLLELLVVIGIMGLLAGGVIMAINPSSQLLSSRDARRKAEVRELRNAVVQFLIDNGDLPGDKTVPSGVSSRIDICREGASDTSGCLVLDTDLIPDYLSALPIDPSETDEDLIGYAIYQDQGGFVTVTPEHLGQIPGSGTTGGSGGGSSSSAGLLGNGQDCSPDNDAGCSSGICDATESPDVCEAADTCGNSEVETGEYCDDGNTSNGDGCNSSCELEDGEDCSSDNDASCESGICDATETPDVCEAADTCGNSEVEGAEECDDGNTSNGDGCDSSCVSESSCAGTEYAGGCWYLGTANQSCTTVCATHGGYDALTKTYAGSDGNVTQCKNVLDALGEGSGNPLSAGPQPYGCTVYAFSSLRYWWSSTTTEGAAHSLYKRACACAE